MKTSWNNVRMIDRYLHKKLKPSHQTLFEEQLTTDCKLVESVKIQKNLLYWLKAYHRRESKKELEQLFQKLYRSNNEFKTKINEIFN